MTALREWIDNMLSRGFLRPSSSPYGAPILFVPKPDGSLRLCCDFRRLNAQTIKDAFPLPRCRDLFDQLRGAELFSSFDMLDGYYNVRMARNSVPKTAIRTPLGSFEFLVLPMGLTNAPSSFSRLMEIAFRELDHKGVIVYLDDVLVYSKNKEEHLRLMKKCFEIFKRYNFRLKPSKCHYFMTHVKFLGHIISKEGIATDPKKIEAVKQWPELKSVQQVQQFMGLVNYYRDHVSEMAKIGQPLTDIQANHLKDVDFATLWKPERKKAFEDLKKALTTTPVLAVPDMNKPFFVTTDASVYAMGGSLEQMQDGKRRVIAFMSKKFTKQENRWSPYERELFAIHEAMRVWRHYVAGAKVIIESDHKPLIWLKSQKTLSRKQANWMTFLEEFQFVINYVPGKEMAIADPLSRRPDHEEAAAEEQAGAQELNSMHLHYHATSNQQGRWVMQPNLFRQIDAEYGPFDNDAFSDEHMAQLNGEGESDFYKTHLAGKHSYINGPYDSKSMGKMMRYYEDQKDTDPFNTSAVFIVPLWEQKQWFQQHFANMQLVQVLHTGQHAFLLPSDRLGQPPGKLVDVGPLQWDVGVFYDAPRFAESKHVTVQNSMQLSDYMTHYGAMHETEVLLAISEDNMDSQRPVQDGIETHPIDGDDQSDQEDDDIGRVIWQNQSEAAGDLQIFAEWIHELKAAYSTDATVNKLSTVATVMDYHVANGVVYYKRRDQGVAKLYVPVDATKLQQKIIAEFHDTPISGHMAAKKTLERLQRFFYWPRMDREVDMFCKSCLTCKRFKRRTVARPTGSQPYPIPDYPWQVLCMDMKSGLPTTSRGVNAFWVFVDKLTRRGHVVPCSTTITAPELARLFFDNVFKHHGIPEVIISDRDSRFGISRESFWRELWSICGTRLNMSTANRPQTDGLAERYIGTMSQMARTFAHANPHNWDLYMSALEFAYNDSVHPATGYTPFQLDTGRDPNTPMQFLLKGIIDRPALYHEQHELIDPTVYLHKYTSRLNGVKKQLAEKSYIAHQRLMNKGTVPIEYAAGDACMVENPLTTHSPGMSTLDRRYDGPYEVIRKEGISKYRIDFKNLVTGAIDFPGRYQILNQDKMIPFVNRDTGEQRMDSETPQEGEENGANNGDEPEPLPPLDNWGADPAQRAHPPADKDKVIGFQKSITNATEVTRVTDYREREVTMEKHDTQHGTATTRHVKQAELLIVFKRPGSNSVRRTWVPMLEVLKHKDYSKVHAYLQEKHPGLQEGDSPLCKHGVAVYNGVPFGAYIVSHEPADDVSPYVIAFEDGDFGDFSATIAQQLIEKKQVDMAVHELHHMNLDRRGKRVHRVLVLCSGTGHDAKGIKQLYPSAKIDTLDIDAKHKPRIHQYILTWAYSRYPRGYYDIIYASPQCTAFSKANQNPSENAVEHATRMVQKCFEILEYFRPYVWILENPVNRLQDMAFMRAYDEYKQTTAYCMYGTSFRKLTNVWSNIDVKLPNCVGDTLCSFKRAWGFHKETAQSGTSKLRDGIIVSGTPPAKAQQMPFELLKFLFKHVYALY